jgi:subtilisin family serine protease
MRVRRGGPGSAVYSFRGIFPSPLGNVRFSQYCHDLQRFLYRPALRTAFLNHSAATTFLPRVLFAALLALTVAVVFSGSASGGVTPPRQPRPIEKTKFDPTTILVKFKAPGEGAKKAQAAGDRALGLIPGARVEVIKLQPGETVAKKLAAYRARDDVLFAEPNYVLQPDSLPPPLIPNDPMLGSQWALTNIAATSGWAIYPGTFSSLGGVKIAIVDTGVYAGHPDLNGKVVVGDGAGCLGSGFICSSAYSSSDDYGHGTHVAGIAGAVADNGEGVAGLAVSSPLIPIKVCFAAAVNGGCPLASIASGIAWAVTKGAKVINLSLGGPSAGTMCAAVTSALAKGVTVVAAAGNEGITTPSYPAACAGAIGVGADGFDNDSAWYGNWDYPNVFISAPGGADFDPAANDPATEILSTVPFSFEDSSPALYESIEGTSMASPFVAGLAALMKSQRPLRTPADIRRALAKTADKVLSPFYGDYGFAYGEYPPRGADPFHVCVPGECTWHFFWGYGQINVSTALLGASPKVLSFTPSTGPVGTVVTISGEDLAAATEVSFGVAPTPAVTGTGRTSTILATPNENSIKVAVADGGITGQISVKTPGGVSTSTGIFKISPKITSFDPASARRVVDTVTIHGENFSGATSVKVGAVVVTSFTVADDETITLTLPPTAITGKLSVTTPSGTATSVANLVVILPPTISGFTPASGPVGTLVTVSGTNLDSVTSGMLNVTPVGAITHLTPTSVRFAVPDGASTGKIALTNTAGTATSLADFKVSPKITSFDPGTARRLVDTVTIHGKNFTGATAVKVGAVAAAGYSVDDDSTITFTVGATAVTGKISVTTAAGTSTSVANLVVILPPTISGFTPASGPVGTLVTVSGTNLDSVTSATLNGTGAGTITHLTASSIRIAVPLGAGPTGNITVTNTAGTATSAGTFTIPFLITSFTPGSGPPGTVVTINGSGLSAVTLVEFNGSPAIPLSVTPTQVTAAVPDQSTSGPIRVITATGSSATSLNSFSVTPPATVQINEVSPDVFGSTDLVELKVLTSGTLQGIQLRQAPSSGPVVLATLPNTTVSAGDLVVVHLFPSGVTTETASKTQCVANPPCYAGAWDVAGNNFGITYSNQVLTVSSEQGAVLDGIAFVRPSLGSTTTAGFRTDLGYLQSIGAWLPVDCGGSACTDATTPSAMTVAADWDAVGTTATGNTAQRSGDADTDTDADWTVGAHSLGATNP